MSCQHEESRQRWDRLLRTAVLACDSVLACDTKVP